MSRSITHLVCWKFEGSKYTLARELGTMIVSHSWFEDCAREGKRLPEHPYLMQSGHQVGHLLWEPPVDVSRESLSSRENGTLFYDRPNIFKNTKEVEIDKESLWPSFHLLSKELLSDRGKKTMMVGTSKNIKLGNQDILLDKPFKGSKKREGSSLSASVLSGNTRSTYGVTGSTSKDQPTRKSRRLVKKSASIVPHEPYRFDYDQEGFPTEHCDRIYNSANGASNDSDDSLTILGCQQERPPAKRNQSSTASTSDGSRNEDPVIPQRSNLADFAYIEENMNEEQEVVEDISVLNNVAITSDLCISNNVEIPSQERMPSARASDFDGADGTHKDAGESDALNKLAELSCVICYTDFSSTRGVLPCGHRFCYSCIREWADHTAARRMVSTCPLCKCGFLRITKLEDADSADQKIYSQTVPGPSSATNDIFMLSDRENPNFGAQHSSAPVCCECRSREHEDLLASCSICRNRWIHSYCLDPPLFPWTCSSCRGLRTMYQRQY